MTNHDTLWAKVMKGLYFPNENLVTTKTGYMASWGWKSVLAGRVKFYVRVFEDKLVMRVIQKYGKIYGTLLFPHTKFNPPGLKILY